MIANYIKSALRNIMRHRAFSLLNVFGLSIGVSCSILIFLWVREELSFDDFNANASHIYRVTSDITDSKAAVIPVPMIPAIRQSLPGIQSATRLKATGALFTIGNKKFEENNGFYTDAEFLQMFSYPLIEGQLATALSRPDGIVITAALARKYFGTTDALGKALLIDNDIKMNALVVTGVLKDIPANSHLQFGFLLPVSLYEKTIDYNGSWGNFDIYGYVQMDKNFTPSRSAIDNLNTKLFELYAHNDSENNKGTFSLQPLPDIHLQSDNLLLDVEGQGSLKYVRIFSLVAIFIIVIAGINFMNLSTAIAARRAKEVGLRKTIGALRKQLVAQFLGESVLLTLISLVIGIAIAALLLPAFNSLTAKSMTFNLLDGNAIAVLLTGALLVGLLSGIYPAFYLSSFSPTQVLKGGKAPTGQKSFFRNALVTVQFSISIILIISTLIVYAQLQFIRNRDMGFDKQNLMYIKMPQVGDLYNNYQALKASLNQYPGIANYSIINYLPANLTTGTTNIDWPGKDPQLQIVFPHLGVDENFAKTFGMQVIAGRFFARDFQGDRDNYVVNETALKIMKMSPASAIGKPFMVNGRKGEIIGAVRDFNFKSVHQTVEPLILKYNASGGNLVIRTAPSNISSILAQVKKVFSEVYADLPFSYGFVDEEIARLYLSEQRMGKLFDLFALLSVVVSCVGLFGLATYAAQSRIREIGVRKVLGASVSGIVGMLTKDFMKPVVIAAAIAFPTAWWLMNQWLQGFAYKVDIGWWIFATAGGIALLIAFITVGFQAVKAAVANPVRSLRTE